MQAPNRFRPGGWTDDTTLWGILRGRLTKLDTRTGETQPLTATAWSVHAGHRVVSWRNETGTWMMRDGKEPLRLASTDVDSTSGFDGPPSILWSPDGTRALLSWEGEWDAKYRLLGPDGKMREVGTTIPGYFGNAAVLWLDSTRVLFQIVAKGPVGKDPEYRESGWRGDLAVLDLADGSYGRVTRVPELAYLRVVGPYRGEVLVTEWDTDNVRAHWLYDSKTWERRPITLPAGRLFSSDAGALVVLVEQSSDSSRAELLTGNGTTPLGTASRDAVPVFAPVGVRGALATGRGLLSIERER